MTPTWYAFSTLPQKEAATRAWFGQRGIEAWYPSEVVWLVNPSKRRKTRLEKPVVSRYVFAAFYDDPNWHDIRERLRYARPMVSNGVPLHFPESALQQMALVPQRIAELREMEREARRIKPGDRVHHPLFDGWAVEVVAVDKGLARFFTPFLGGAEVTAPVEELRKVG